MHIHTSLVEETMARENVGKKKRIINENFLLFRQIAIIFSAFFFRCSVCSFANIRFMNIHLRQQTLIYIEKRVELKKTPQDTRQDKIIIIFPMARNNTRQAKKTNGGELITFA